MPFDETDIFLQLIISPWGRVVAGIWGALWGSFFNVLILRLPNRESVVHPASHCRSCSAPIAWYDNIPLLSYLLLRGRCRSCRSRFSSRYFLVELLVCVLALLLHHALVVHGSGLLNARLAQWFIASLFCGLLVAISFIDLDTMTIPDVITYPGIPLCILLSLFMAPAHLWDGLVGALGGYVLIRLLADGYRLLTGRDGMGYGDAKLLAMIGGLLGWQAILPTVFLASFQGSIIGISSLLFIRWRKKMAVNRTQPDHVGTRSMASGTDVGTRTSEQKEHDEHEPPQPSASADDPGTVDEAADAAAVPLRYASLPFGPFLSLAAIEAIFLKEYLSLFYPFFW